MKKGKVLFVDDELQAEQDEPHGDYMWYYVRALQDADFEVTPAIGPDEALHKLSTKEAQFDLVIIDIMMPPGKTFEKEDTFEGLRTGIFLARIFQERYSELPILVLTNVLNPQALNETQEIVNVKEVLTKPNCTPFHLAEEVKHILEQ